MQPKQLPITTVSNPGNQSNSDDNSSGYWRSLNQLEGSEEFEQHLHREFPQAASEFPDGVSRRRWLKLMSASLALSGAAGCRYGPEEIASLVVRDPGTTPGVPRHYATNFELAGRAVNLLVTNVDGRPIKTDGNPDHPQMKASEPNDLSGGKERFASAGSDVFTQGCVLGLYDDDRTEGVWKRGEGELEQSSWEAFAEYLEAQRTALEGDGGKSFAVLMSPSLSPTVNRLVGQIAKSLPEAKVCQFSSVEDGYQRAAATQAAGQPAELLLDMSQAKVICCLDSDPLGVDANSVVYSRQFAKNREPVSGKMNRLYSVEARYSVTGSSSDSRLAVRSSQIGAFLAKLSAKVDELLEGGSAAMEAAEPFDKVDAEQRLERMVTAMADDLVANKGHGVVYVGAQQSLAVQLAALKLNEKLENLGTTVHLRPSRAQIEGVEPIAIDELYSSLTDGSVDNLLILGDNPVYTTPSSIDLGGAIEKLENVVYLGEYKDETAKKSAWVLPLAHQLESWGDVTSSDGTYGVCQPQILPLLGGKSMVDILAMLAGSETSGEELIKETVSSMASLNSRAWRELLHDGYLKDSAAESLSGSVGDVDGDLGSELNLEEFENGELEVVFAASDVLYDGRFAKNVWLQELPQSITKLTWDNAAILSPATAKSMDLDQGEIVKLVVDDRNIELPAFLVPGTAPGVIVAPLGYGRVCRDEAVNSDEQVEIGSDVGPLRSTDNMFIQTGVEARPTGKMYKLATTQDHFAIDELGLSEVEKRAPRLVREGTLEKIEEHGKNYVADLGIHSPPLESLWDEPMNTEFEVDDSIPYQWGMTIDLNKCTGCNSCVIACQSENNTSVVGKEQVSRGREMHWIRVDRYFRGERDMPQMVHQPVACAHCETAPCEQVCPVAATVHTEEGINAMAYNRCIGTRYCANNCPYKVRRFNYFNYNTEYGYFYGWQQRGKIEEASRKLQQLVLNPEVSVRGRGVMEKCTYCVQRVQNVKINARAEGRLIEDGEVISACQAACPTQAITFGNIKDPESIVSKLQRSPRAYDMLAELNIKPRTRYLARVRNTHELLLTESQLEPYEPHH
ncbi:MAG TPA: molybdopterin oxidoreductase, partial [Planctomycetaceae bacterium]|nr:molybdopterin oxidoreductase [Planctomycetaceae bacterium]